MWRGLVRRPFTVSTFARAPVKTKKNDMKLIVRNLFLRISVGAFFLGMKKASGQSESEKLNAARLLSSIRSRQSMIEHMLTDPTAWDSIGLRWFVDAPSDVNPNGLFAGLAQYFKIRKNPIAIRGLIQRIDFEEFPQFGLWTRSEKVIRERLVAVDAVVAMGEMALPHLIRSLNEPCRTSRRMAILFAIYLIDTSEARSIIRAESGYAELILGWRR